MSTTHIGLIRGIAEAYPAQTSQRRTRSRTHGRTPHRSPPRTRAPLSDRTTPDVWAQGDCPALAHTSSGPVLSGPFCLPFRR